MSLEISFKAVKTKILENALGAAEFLGKPELTYKIGMELNLGEDELEQEVDLAYLAASERALVIRGDYNASYRYLDILMVRGDNRAYRQNIKPQIESWENEGGRIV